MHRILVSRVFARRSVAPLDDDRGGGSAVGLGGHKFYMIFAGRVETDAVERELMLVDHELRRFGVHFLDLEDLVVVGAQSSRRRRRLVVGGSTSACTGTERDTEAQHQQYGQASSVVKKS